MDTFNSMRATNAIELCPLEYMRGRNFHNAFMILDEAQNATFEQIKMFLTRIGLGSKAVVNGDLDQTDLDGVAICRLTDDDIVRNGIISKILGRLR
jgi:phosphate starvation-inducible PhoH-like protein